MVVAGQASSRLRLPARPAGRPAPRSGGSPRAEASAAAAPALDGLVLRIDPPLEEDLQIRIDARLPEAAAHERVDAEGREVPLVETDRVAKRDRPVRVRLRREQREELLGAPPVLPEPGESGLPIDRRSLPLARS